MGRSAKHWTLEEKKNARNARRRLNGNSASVKAQRQRQNQAAYWQGKDPPSLTSDVTALLKYEISRPLEEDIFSRFLAGQDTLAFDTYVLDIDHFEGLIGSPPYPTIELMFEDWDAISAALHGYMVNRYIHTLDTVREGLRRKTSGSIVRTMWDQYKEHMATLKTLQDFASKHRCFDEVSLENSIVLHNLLWTARLVEYTVRDLTVVHDLGMQGLVLELSERQWQMRRASD